MIGAEIIRNDISGPYVITITDLDESDRDLFREAVFEHSAVVIKQQEGIDPNTLPALAAIWDETVQGTHSGDLTALKSEKTVLSANKAERIPRARQVTVIGEGRFDGYEGLPTVDLHHVVCLLLRFHKVTSGMLRVVIESSGASRTPVDTRPARRWGNTLLPMALRCTLV